MSSQLTANNLAVHQANQSPGQGPTPDPQDPETASSLSASGFNNQFHAALHSSHAEVRAQIDNMVEQSSVQTIDVYGNFLAKHLDGFDINPIVTNMNQDQLSVGGRSILMTILTCLTQHLQIILTIVLTAFDVQSANNDATYSGLTKKLNEQKIASNRTIQVPSLAQTGHHIQHQTELFRLAHKEIFFSNLRLIEPPIRSLQLQRKVKEETIMWIRTL